MGKNVHVVKHDGRWQVKVEGKQSPISSHKNQELARQNAVPIAGKNGAE